MNTMQPIREVEILKDIQDYLYIKKMRDYVLFCTGIYSPIRIADILPLKVRDVRNKKYISVREKKTGKENKIRINNELRKILDKYIEDKQDYEYLFESRQKTKKGVRGPITRQQAYNILQDVAEEFHIEAFGCHTMRKTFGYHYYQQTHDIETLRCLYNHHNSGITARYIGLTQVMVDKAVEGFKYY
ncbi:tyrosine-type recombinase/integrase [Vallitalea guaymasensis]|uniref:tyrosine-type recombinase/integrase n=1 Tax=Vallitalea guaymasensis TaxID=1185412 RepID=UPI000DE41A92|nr:tyrosine-type recombinase/integrase [Vallitalea guaymasensis]